MAAFLGQRPYLTDGFNLPSPVPEDLLIPWGDFMQRNQLRALATIAFEYVQGFGNILAQPTLYVLRDFARVSFNSILSSGSINTTNKDTQAIYNKALAKLGSSAFVNADVREVERCDNGVRVVFSTAMGLKVVQSLKAADCDPATSLKPCIPRH